jgi:dienelactone hydrolase
MRANMELQPIIYEANGERFSDWLADGSGGGRAPGVLVLHEGAGLTDQIGQRAARLAVEFGCVAYAPDLFGTPPPAPGDAAALAAAQAVVRGLREDVAMLRGRCAAALAVLERHESVDSARLAAVGYCFGGAAAIELARAGAPLKAVAGFHAGVLPGDDQAIRAKVLLCHGAEDPVVPAARIHEFVAALGAAGGRLAAPPLRRRRPQLHQPRDRCLGPAGVQLRRAGRRALVGGARPAARRGLLALLFAAPAAVAAAARFGAAAADQRNCGRGHSGGDRGAGGDRGLRIVADEVGGALGEARARSLGFAFGRTGLGHGGIGN